MLAGLGNRPKWVVRLLPSLRFMISLLCMLDGGAPRCHHLGDDAPDSRSDPRDDDHLIRPGHIGILTRQRVQSTGACMGKITVA